MQLAEDVVCVNPACRDVGIKGRQNVYVRRTRNGVRYVRCRTCRAEFSERKGTPLFDLKVPQAKAIDTVKHLAEGVGVRATARLTGVSRDTVGRILKRVGLHAKATHDAHVQGLDIPEAQMDEMWSFVGKKRQTAQRSGARGRRPR
jgi:transposase-like protein